MSEKQILNWRKGFEEFKGYENAYGALVQKFEKIYLDDELEELYKSSKDGFYNQKIVQCLSKMEYALRLVYSDQPLFKFISCKPKDAFRLGNALN